MFIVIRSVFFFFFPPDSESAAHSIPGVYMIVIHNNYYNLLYDAMRLYDLDLLLKKQKKLWSANNSSLGNLTPAIVSVARFPKTFFSIQSVFNAGSFFLIFAVIFLIILVF